MYQKKIYTTYQPPQQVEKKEEEQVPVRTQPVQQPRDILIRTDGKDFDETDKKIFSALNYTQNLLRTIAIMHDLAKNTFHAKGLQGFKRLHRYWAREYFEAAMKIESAMIDYYHIMPVLEVNIPRDYTVKTVEDTFYHNHDNLEMAETKISALINEVVLLPDSFATCILKEALELIRCEHKYADRDKHYCMDVDWNIANIHIYSHELHERYKVMEKECHNREFEM